MTDVTLNDDATELTVHVPLTFKERGGRKVVIAPATTAVPSPDRSTVDKTLIKALARSYRWKGLLESGAYATAQDLALADKINPSYLARVLRLSLLSPTIVEAILDGRQAQGIELDRLLKPFPVEWNEQQRFFDLEAKDPTLVALKRGQQPQG